MRLPPGDKQYFLKVLGSGKGDQVIIGPGELLGCKRREQLAFEQVLKQFF